jgi:predicted  nucleic acid-binding Zn-ribbon protein
MNTLATLKELQMAHDGLRAIERDLSAYPPEMARLDASAKAAEKKLLVLAESLAKAKARQETLEKQLVQATKAEAHAKGALKASTHKGQYTIAMRDLDGKERQLDAAQKAVLEASDALKSMETEKNSLEASHKEDRRQFGELMEIFLAEHENQVAAKSMLTEKIGELSGQLDQATLTKFSRIMQSRGGKAVAPVENGICTGCNTKLRTPLIYQMKAQGFIFCESCQRVVYLG